jgi:hypothetical protein
MSQDDIVGSVIWSNYLPSQQNRRIVKVGSNRADLLRAYCNWGCSEIACIGPPRNDVSSAAVEYHPRLDALTATSYGACLFDELSPPFGGRVLARLEHDLETAHSVLADDGVVVVTMPAGWRRLPYRIAVERLLASAGFLQTDTLLCVPSVDTAGVVFPLSLDPAFTKKALREAFSGNRRPKSWLKAVAKYLLVILNPRSNACTGLAVIGRKGAGSREAPSAARWLSRHYPQPGIVPDKVYAIWRDKPWSRRQIGFFYYGDPTKRLIAVCKRTMEVDGYTSGASREFQALTLLTRHAQALSTRHIVVPRPIHWEVGGRHSSAIQTAISGVSLWELGRREAWWTSDRSTIDELVDVQIAIQEVLTAGLRDEVRLVSPHYFENTADLSFANGSTRLREYGNYVQHGDYTSPNIVREEGTDMWGVIDWEGLGTGFPPLFDIYSLFSSFGDEGPSDPVRFVRRRRQYFLSTFFRSGFLNSALRAATAKYCQRFELDTGRSFDYLMDCLLYQYNKYRRADSKTYADLYGAMLRDALDNRRQFLGSDAQ